MSYRNLVVVLSLGLSSPMALAGAPANSAGEKDCNHIISQSHATQKDLSLRATNVQHCLDLAESVATSAYKNTMPYCKNLALAHTVPDQIVLGSIEGVTALASLLSASWEDYAMQLGEGAASAGCRDGILSALEQILFTDVDKVRTIFRNSYLELTNQFLGAYDIRSLTGGLASQLKIQSSLMSAQFTSVDQLTLGESGNFVFQAIPMTSALTLDGSVGSFFGTTSFEVGTQIDAHLSGTLNPRTLEVLVTDYHIQSIHTGDTTPAGMAVEAFLIANFEYYKISVTENVSRELTRRLRQAYNETDPFEFLATEAL